MAKLNEDVKVVMLKGEKGERGEPGTGIPTGGKTGQAIIKASDNDYDYKWGSLVVNDVTNATNDGNGNNIANTYATKTELNTAKTEASDTYLTKTDASDTYLTKTDASNTYATKAELANTANFDKIYPIGSIYMSVNGTSPATLFGGTWEQIKNGFLVSAGYAYANWVYLCKEAEFFTLNESAQVRFGANDAYVIKTLSAGTYAADKNTFGSDPIENVQKHVDIYRETLVPGDVGGEATHKLTMYEMPSYTPLVPSSATTTPNVDAVPLLNPSSTTAGQAHNNMPPYLAVYMWKRTA